MFGSFAPFALIAFVSPALAQTVPAPSQQQPGLGGPVVPGVCLLSREAVFANAKVSAAATARLKQIADAAQAEVDAQRKPLEPELKAFETESPKLSAEARAQRQQALATRLKPVQDLASQRSREVEATRAKALQHIADQAQPVIAQVYTQRKCGLLVDRNSVMGGNFTNDLTADVVKALDVKISTIAFERETPPASVQTAARR